MSAILLDIIAKNGMIKDAGFDACKKFIIIIFLICTR